MSNRIDPLAEDPSALVRAARRALVVFEDRDEAGWRSWLRPGFRHCFCILGDGELWTIVDPLLTRIEVVLCRAAAEADLISHLGTTGRLVLAGPIVGQSRARPQLPRPLTCVEVVKRMLNLDAPGVLTPWQLQRRLRQTHGFRAYGRDDAADSTPDNRLAYGKK